MEATAEPVFETQPIAQLRIAGFWRRLAALFVDALLLGIAGYALGSILGERFAPAGTPARLVGLVVLLPYLGLLGSRIGKGQTLGKRLMGIRVAAADGGYLSPGKAFLRAALLGLPWMLNGLRFGSASGLIPRAALWLAGVLIFGVGVAIVGTYVLNRRSRQALHDLVAGSWVVVAEEAERAPPPRSTRRPLVASLVWIGIVAVALTGLAGWSGSPAHQELAGPWRTISDLPGVSSSIVAQPTMHTNRRSSSFRSLQATVWFAGPEGDLDRLERDVASAMFEHPEIENMDALEVRIVRGWDVGIASSTTTRTVALSPTAWRERLER